MTETVWVAYDAPKDYDDYRPTVLGVFTDRDKAATAIVNRYREHSHGWHDPYATVQVTPTGELELWHGLETGAWWFAGAGWLWIEEHPITS